MAGMNVSTSAYPRYPISKLRWVCPACEHLRRSAYCPDCGQKAPDRSDIAADQMDVLRQMERRLRTTQAGETALARTLEAKPDGYDKHGYFQRNSLHAEKRLANAAVLKAQADALLWALDQLETIGEKRP